MIGDRYEYVSDHGFIVEIISHSPHERHKLISNPRKSHNYPVGMLGEWGPFDFETHWRYLGNFSKVSNVHRLYDKLCS